MAAIWASFLHRASAWLTRGLTALALSGAMAAQTTAASATQPQSAFLPQSAAPKVQSAYVVGNDYGGSVRKRLIDIRALTHSARMVEIRGEVCYSSCTMLLGLSTVCIHPKTQFGFHGPSRAGRALPKPLFDHVSQLIASHYPPRLRVWYLAVARHKLNGVYTVTGKDLIALRVAKPCVPDVPATLTMAAVAR